MMFCSAVEVLSLNTRYHQDKHEGIALTGRTSNTPIAIFNKLHVAKRGSAVVGEKGSPFVASKRNTPYECTKASYPISDSQRLTVRWHDARQLLYQFPNYVGNKTSDYTHNYVARTESPKEDSNGNEILLSSPQYWVDRN